MFSRSRIRKTKNNQSKAKYTKYWPLLVLSSVFFGWFFSIISRIFPSEVANVFVHNAYIPVLIPFYFGTFFLLGYILLNMPRASILSLLLTLLFLFKLQMITPNFWWIVILIFFLLLSFLIKNEPSIHNPQSPHTQSKPNSESST